MNATRLLIVLAAVALIVWVWRRAASGPSRSAQAQLHGICLGNAAQAERLIAAEMTRAPGITREEAARRAIDRYRRDNR